MPSLIWPPGLLMDLPSARSRGMTGASPRKLRQISLGCNQRAWRAARRHVLFFGGRKAGQRLGFEIFRSSEGIVMRTDSRFRSNAGLMNALGAAAATMMMLSPAMAQNAPSTLRIGNLKFSASVDLWLAQRKGMFAANGLQVTFTDFRNGQECVSALQ